MLLFMDHKAHSHKTTTLFNMGIKVQLKKIYKTINKYN